MTIFDPKRNFAVSTVLAAPTPALTGTTLQVAIGEGSLFPVTGAGQAFNAVVWPANAPPTVANAEIVRVVRAGDAFAITRAQEGSTARAIQVGDRIMEGITVKALTDLEAAVNAATGAVALTAAPILEPGVAGQVSRGRVLALPDFTTLLGLAAPVAGYNLTDLTDFSGNGRSLTNKGAVAFGSGILGAATEAAIFTGSTAQALYVADTGAGDPFRIPYGSVGCWFRTAKRGTFQDMLAKAAGAFAGGYVLEIGTDNVAHIYVWTTAQFQAAGVTDVCDDRWHHLVGTYDGTTVSLYVDGVLESSSAVTGGPIGGTYATPLNVGGRAADGATAATNPHFGRVDEAFVTQDVLSLDQVRVLYAAKVAHGLGAVPVGAKMSVRRLRKGASLGTGSFSAPPLHLYNFIGGVLTDAGSLGNALTNNGGALPAPAADGTQANALNFVAASSQYLSCSDAGAPSGTAARTFGCWFKASTVLPVAAYNLINYGTSLTNCVIYINNLGQLTITDGVTTAGAGAVCDGQWHFATVVVNPTATDGLLAKLYLDGKLVASLTTFAGTTLAGAAGFLVGANHAPANFMSGALDAVFLTGYAMDSDEVAKIYAQGDVSLGASPKNAGDHVEAMDAMSVYLIADTLDSQHQIDLEVTA